MIGVSIESILQQVAQLPLSERQLLQQLLNDRDVQAVDFNSESDLSIALEMGYESGAEPEMEYPVTLAYTSEPVACLVGTVKIMGRGRQDFALSDQEWQDLGLPNESMEEAEEMADAASTK